MKASLSGFFPKQHRVLQLPKGKEKREQGRPWGHEGRGGNANRGGGTERGEREKLAVGVQTGDSAEDSRTEKQNVLNVMIFKKKQFPHPPTPC